MGEGLFIGEEDFFLRDFLKDLGSSSLVGTASSLTGVSFCATACFPFFLGVTTCSASFEVFLLEGDSTRRGSLGASSSLDLGAAFAADFLVVLGAVFEGAFEDAFVVSFEGSFESAFVGSFDSSLAAELFTEALEAAVLEAGALAGDLAGTFAGDLVYDLAPFLTGEAFEGDPFEGEVSIMVADFFRGEAVVAFSFDLAK
mmetsp:Transcript_1767/g.2280  ORF Transcript_1767/g.2280 Transcript_1767/m.2280 type:complete len:200 (-) Transcript_1767:21-620(-)